MKLGDGRSNLEQQKIIHLKDKVILMITTSSWWLQLQLNKNMEHLPNSGQTKMFKTTTASSMYPPGKDHKSLIKKGTFELMISQLSAKNCSPEGNYFIHFVQIQIKVKHTIFPMVPTKSPMSKYPLQPPYSLSTLLPTNLPNGCPDICGDVEHRSSWYSEQLKN